MFEGALHFEEEARYFSDETIAKLQALKEFCNKPEFQDILREDRLKDDEVVKHLRANTILRDYIDLPHFQLLIRPSLKDDPEVQSIMTQVDKEFAHIEKIGVIEWKKRIEQEKKKKEGLTTPTVLVKENPKKWLPFYFNAYLEHPSTDWLVYVKDYVDRPGVQVELKGEFKDDEELQSIASQINKLWEDYQKNKEEKKKKFLERMEKEEQERRKYQMEQQEEEQKWMDSKINIPRFD